MSLANLDGEHSGPHCRCAHNPQTKIVAACSSGLVGRLSPNSAKTPLIVNRQQQACLSQHAIDRKSNGLVSVGHLGHVKIDLV